MLEEYEKDDIKIIDWGTSRKFNPDLRMKRLVGTVSNIFIFYNVLSLIILHQKFLKEYTMKNVMFGLLELFVTLSCVDALLSTEQIRKLWQKSP